MNMSSCLGLIGGLGVGATVQYYKELTKAHEARGRTLGIVITHAEISRVFQYIQRNDHEGLAEHLSGYIHRLQGAPSAARRNAGGHAALLLARAQRDLSVASLQYLRASGAGA